MILDDPWRDPRAFMHAIHANKIDQGIDFPIRNYLSLQESPLSLSRHVVRVLQSGAAGLCAAPQPH